MKTKFVRILIGCPKCGSLDLDVHHAFAGDRLFLDSDIWYAHGVVYKRKDIQKYFTEVPMKNFTNQSLKVENTAVWATQEVLTCGCKRCLYAWAVPISSVNPQ